MPSPNPYAGQAGAYTYDPGTDTWTQVVTPTTPAPAPNTPPPNLTTSSGDLKVVTSQT